MSTVLVSQEAPRYAGHAMARPLLMILALAALLAALSAGCGGAAPYEREYLATPAMDSQSEASETGFRSHVHDSREGATGGHGSTGGGCGCN